jgi:hypothetical protein
MGFDVVEVVVEELEEAQEEDQNLHRNHLTCQR